MLKRLPPVYRQAMQEDSSTILSWPNSSCQSRFVGILGDGGFVDHCLFIAFLSISLDWKWLKSKIDIDRNSDGATSGSDMQLLLNLRYQGDNGGNGESIFADSIKSSSNPSFRSIPGFCLAGFTFGMVHMSRPVNPQNRLCSDCNGNTIAQCQDSFPQMVVTPAQYRQYVSRRLVLVLLCFDWD